MDRTRRDTLLGLVFFGTLAFLLWATVNLTDVSLGSVPPIEVRFADGGGAQVGTNVLVLGKKIGKVAAIDIDFDDAEAPVRMQLRLEAAIPLTDRMTIEVQADGVLGGKLIYIDPGRGAPISGTGPFRGTTQKNAFESISDLAEGRGPLGENVDAMVTAIRLGAESLQDENNSLGRLLRRRELYDEVLQAMQRMNGILEAIQAGQSTFGRLAVDTAMGEQVQALVDNLAKASATLTTTDGTFGTLLNDKETAEKVRAIVADTAELIADAKAGRGIM
ncbi:MAG: MCE family protein, partial [Planctomycetes bacterium]|nr:MCE family protein [Planctomycetota bacterium]